MDVNLIDAIDNDYGRTPLIICSCKKSEAHFKITKCLLDSGCKFSMLFCMNLVFFLNKQNMKMQGDVNIQANYKWNNWVCIFNLIILFLSKIKFEM